MFSKWMVISVISLVLIIIVAIYIVQQSIIKPSIEQSSMEDIYPPRIHELIKDKPLNLNITIPSFQNNSYIPVKYTCDGENILPDIIVENISSRTVSITIIIYDPDAPKKPFYHWIIYDVKVNGSKIVLTHGNASTSGYIIRNDFGDKSYGGPCPPPGDKPHRYVFLVLGLDTFINKVIDDYNALFEEIKDHVVEYGVYIGYYKR